MNRITTQQTTSITSLAIDAAEHKFAENYCELYAELYCAKEEQFALLPKFYIRDLKLALKKIPKTQRKALTKFFALEGGIKHSQRRISNKDIAFINMLVNVKEAICYLQSIECVYMYNQTFRECVDQLAKKVYDPKGEYTNVQKAKYCHLYFAYISTFQYLPYEKEPRRTLTEEEKLIEKGRCLVADTIVDECKDYYANFPDGDLIIPMIDSWLFELDEDDENFIKEKCQISENKHTLECFAEMRRVKESAFKCGEWINSDFCRISTFQELSVKTVKDLCMSYLVYKKDYEWKAPKNINKRVLFRNTGFKKVVVPQLYGNVAFKDEFEMIQFLDMIEYLDKEIPELEFHGKPFKSYGFNELQKSKIE